MQTVRAHARGDLAQPVYGDRAGLSAPREVVVVAVKAGSMTLREFAWPRARKHTFDVTGSERTRFIPSHGFSGVVAASSAWVEGPAERESVYGLILFSCDGPAAAYDSVPAAVVADEPMTTSQRPHWPR